MLINKENYEIYAIDYLDGELDEALIAPMEQFLEQHPEIWEELEAMQGFVLEPDETVIYQHKAALKKPVKGIVWWQWSLLGAFLLILIVGSTLFFTKNLKSDKQELGKIEKVEKKSALEQTKQQKETIQNIAVSGNQEKEEETANQKASTKEPQAASLPQQDQPVKSANTPQVESGANKQVNPAKQPTEKAPASFLLDSTKLAPKPAVDSSKLLLPKDIQSLPMAVNDNRKLHIQENELANDHKMIVEAMAQVEQLNNQPVTAPKRKKIKTPFGNIKLGEIAEALIPESFVASKN